MALIVIGPSEALYGEYVSASSFVAGLYAAALRRGIARAQEAGRPP